MLAERPVRARVRQADYSQHLHKAAFVVSFVERTELLPLCAAQLLVALPWVSA